MDILKQEIRKPIVSGLFYPENPEELKQKTEELLSPFSRGKAEIIMIPHGTWKNTGTILASAFAAAADYTPRRIVLLGPVHRESSPQKIYLPSKKYFETPLGMVPLDHKMCRDLTRESDLFALNDSPHMEEHALELGIPFIQILFPETPIIPLLTGRLNGGNIKKAAARMRKVFKKEDENTLVILSVNLSRFGPVDETEKESRTFLQNLGMPLTESLVEMEKSGFISSCGTTLLTLLSATRWAEGRSAALLERGKTVVNEKGVDKAVFYAGVSWNTVVQEERP